MNGVVDDLDRNLDGNREAIWSTDERDGNCLQLAGAHPTLTIRNLLYDGNIDAPAAGVEFFLYFGTMPQANGFVPPMDMTKIGAAAENRPLISRFELGADEALIQGLMGMTFRTFHFDGVVRLRQDVQWVSGCDVRKTHAFHRDVLKFVENYPNAKFLWSHRDPAKVLGSVCSLIAAEQLTCWAEVIERVMDFWREFGGGRFVGVSFADLQTDPATTVARSYAQLGFTFSDARKPPRRIGPTVTSQGAAARTRSSLPTMDWY